MIKHFFSWPFAWLQTAKAQGCDPSKAICDPTGTGTLEDLLNKGIDFVFWLSVVILPIMILWGAFLMVTSLGDPGKFETGKKTIVYAVWGFLFVLISKGIGFVIVDILK